MAKKLSEIYVDFTGRLGKLKEAMGKAKGLVKKGMTSLGKLAKRGAIALGVGLVAGIGLSIRAFISFEQQMAKVATMLSEQAMTIIPRYARAAKDLAVRFGEGTASIAEGLYLILSASIPVTKAIKVLRASMMAAKAGFTDTATAADIITTALNAYGISADKATEVADKLLMVQKRGKTSLAEFAKPMGKVLGLAAALGVPFEEVNAALATMTRNGVPTAEALTYIKGSLVALTGRSKESVEVAKEYGITLSALGLSTEGYIKTIEKLSHLTPDITSKIVKETEALTGIAVLTKDLDGLTEDLKLQFNATGESMRGQSIVAATLGEKFKRLWQSINALAVDLATTFAPMMKKVVDALVEKFSGMRDELAVIWYGVDKDFEKFLRIMLQIAAVKVRQLVANMKVYGRQVADSFYSAMYERAVEWNRKYLPTVYKLLYKKWEREQEEREARLERGYEHEIRANREVADAKIAGLLEEAGVREGLEKYIGRLEGDRANREAKYAEEYKKGEEDEVKRLAASAVRRQTEAERLATERRKTLAEEAAAAAKKARGPMEAAAGRARMGFAEFGQAWKSIVTQLAVKKVEEQQLRKQEEIIKELKKGNINTDEIIQVIQNIEGGFAE